MLWWFDTKMYVVPGTSRSSPSTRTRTPVVARMSRDHSRAQAWAKRPERSTRLEATEIAPSTIV